MAEKRDKLSIRKTADKDALDNEILNILQTDFPVDPHPYRVLAEKVGISEAEMIERVQGLKDRKIVRRIGASFERRKLGYVSTLVAAKIDEDRIGEFVKAVNEYSGVTHNYERDHPYNIWFTYIAPSPEKLREVLDTLRAHPACEDLQNLPAERFYKIRVQFAFDEEGKGRGAATTSTEQQAKQQQQ